MDIGCLGDIVFTVSSNKILTFNNAKWSGSASISTHSRHLDNSLTEFTGVDPDGFTLNIYLSEHLGCSVQEEINKLWNYERNGTAVPLTIGVKGYGKYKWLVKNHDIAMENYDRYGNLTSATVSVTLTEYLKE